MAVKADHRTFQSQRGGTAIQDEIHRIAQIVGDMRRQGGADMAGTIGRRRGHRARLLHQGPRHGMGGHAQRQRIQPGADQQVDGAVGAARQHQRQGARPEGAGQRFRCRMEQAMAAGGVQVRDMDDQGIETRPALGGENPRHGLAIAGVRAQAINGLGGEGDQPAARQQPRRMGDGRVIGCGAVFSVRVMA